MKKVLKWVALSIYSSFVISMLSMVAIAGTSYSSWGYHTTEGYNYKTRSVIQTTTSTAYADTRIGPSGSQTIPIGYAGAKAIMYNSSGTQIKEGTWQYNQQSLLQDYLLVTTISHDKSGTYYSYGLTRSLTTDRNALYYPYYQYIGFASGNQTL